MNTERWLLPEGDLHLRIWLTDTVFDYAATAEAARNLVHDWIRKRWCAIELVQEAVEDSWLMPRLPCERLFLGP
ncbi:hypothetical protein K7711_43725 [Nocardia sp. CA2R105]|uniref:hypothetical protein n=1 Tax=Nocardia coffeae TaxID=2873381 RepID=UPI001CA76188|nr:hypothetical protein [Nocardia coffeae]MBY8863442.1 hypothetical protein [Nocardia coffeae]